MKISHKLLYQARDISTAPYGEYWRQMRSVCVLQLLSAKRVHSFRNVREEETALLLEIIGDQSSSSFPVNLSGMFGTLANDIICRVVLGRKYGGEGEVGGFKELLGEFMRLLGSFSVGDFIPWLWWVNRINGLDSRVERVAEAFDEFLDGVVDQHLEDSRKFIKGEEGKDVVDVLLGIQEDSEKDGFSMDRDSIKAVILDMFVGGTDTTYTVLEWAMAELLRHPRILKKLQDEVTEVSKGKPDISESDLDKMPYLKAVIKETLRLYSPIPLLAPRESSQDAKIKGFDIPAETMVIVNAWAIGRDRELWDEPEEFRPERFLNSAVDFKGNDGFQLIPFGGGRRSCPGVLFAMTTNELVLANLVHRFDWALPHGTKVEDLDMTECIGLIIHRKVPLLAIPTPRF
ncbi:hypothetical protein TIFTF001_026011 [Ficus carica]|uniref:Cytochrome P450 n=1 Tax=Ficus carica TaxID=3494 RepID=A0AA88AKV2_FICCA|nr:hypothetical protein TIFTF001_026011 [Ficus carica]